MNDQNNFPYPWQQQGGQQDSMQERNNPNFPQQPFPNPNFPPQMNNPNFPQQALVQTPQVMPQFNSIDNDVVRDLYNQTKVQRGGGNYKFIQFLDGSGNKNWANTSVGYKAVIRVMLLPPAKQGMPHFKIIKKHFWKGYQNPKGASIICVDGCLICKARDLALTGYDENIKKRAKDFGQSRATYLYQVALLDDPQQHVQDNKLVPMLLEATSQLHTAIGDLAEDKGGPINFCNPNNCRPLKLKKKKIGPQIRDVEYSATDEDLMPLPQHLWGLLENLIDLDEFGKTPSIEDQQKAIMDIGLPIPEINQAGFPGNPYSSQMNNPNFPPPMNNPNFPPQMNNPNFPPQMNNPNFPPQMNNPNFPPQMNNPNFPPPMNPPRIDTIPEDLARRIRGK